MKGVYVFMASSDNITFNINAHNSFNTRLRDIESKLTNNSKANTGFVIKGDGNANKMWATDSAGNPGWSQINPGTFVGTTAPATSSLYLTWIDTSTSPALLKYRTSLLSSSWINVGAVWSS